MSNYSKKIVTIKNTSNKTIYVSLDQLSSNSNVAVVPGQSIQYSATYYALISEQDGSVIMSFSNSLTETQITNDIGYSVVNYKIIPGEEDINLNFGYSKILENKMYTITVVNTVSGRTTYLNAPVQNIPGKAESSVSNTVSNNLSNSVSNNLSSIKKLIPYLIPGVLLVIIFIYFIIKINYSIPKNR